MFIRKRLILIKNSHLEYWFNVHFWSLKANFSLSLLIYEKKCFVSPEVGYLLRLFVSLFVCGLNSASMYLPNYYLS
jgi:hypothetical protein